MKFLSYISCLTLVLIALLTINGYSTTTKTTSSQISDKKDSSTNIPSNTTHRLFRTNQKESKGSIVHDVIMVIKTFATSLKPKDLIFPGFLFLLLCFVLALRVGKPQPSLIDNNIKEESIEKETTSSNTDQEAINKDENISKKTIEDFLNEKDETIHEHLAKSQFNVGLMFESGNGVKKDNVQAFYWYEKAASLGSTEAKYKLGIFYKNGIGTVANQELAISWLHKASADNYAPASKELSAIRKTQQGDLT